MVETAGTKLRRARTLRQLNIEDAARATKIRPRQLADLERDEYSNFANLAYARSYLLGYAKFLHVDVRAHLEVFEDTNTFGMDDYQYLSEEPVGVYRVPTRRFRRRKPRIRFVAAGTTLALLAVAATAWFLVVSYRRLGPLDELAARQKAREHAVQPGGTAVEAASTRQRPAAVPSSGETIPVSAPVSQSPAPSAPAPVPVNDQTASAPAALAAAENATAVPVGALAAPAEASVPAMLLPGDGSAARALTLGTDLRATLAGAPGGPLNGLDNSAASTQAKIRAAKPALDPTKRPADPFQGNAPQPVSNNTVR